MPPVPTPQAITLNALTVAYREQVALHQVSARIAPGSLVALVGPNGAGKSSLIKALAGALPPTSGQVTGLAEQRVAWLDQHTSLDTSFPTDVRRMVAAGLWHRTGALGWFTAAHRQLCADALASVGLGGFESRSLNALSGGQMQRALFARLILQDAPVVLLDEPFAAVDGPTSADLLSLLHQWHAQGKTVIVALHNLTQVREHFPLTLMLARELVAFGPTAEVLNEANWARAQREPIAPSGSTRQQGTTAEAVCGKAAQPALPAHGMTGELVT
ncbi:MAG: ABC transporter ATP-binding protein [Burkholderiaceae bacterium]